MGQHNEASVEEILESIKRVIARDNREGALDARRQRESSDAVAEANPGDVKPEPDSSVSAEEVLDLSDMAFDDFDLAPESSQPEIDSFGDDDAPLITEAARGAMQENLAALAMLAEPGARPQIVRSGETSLEGLTRELLRPMLSEWLDKNLPSLVEKLVQAEIARIAGKKS